jgi:NAD(P)H-nitrite reductase large subunit
LEVSRLYLILGNSIAAISAVEALRKVDPNGSITIVAKEGEPAYSPVLTPYYIAGELPRERLYLRKKSFYREHKVELICNDGAAKVFTDRKEVLLESGVLLKYDRLLIATGGRPRPAAFPGAALKGVFVLRSLLDAANIRNYALGKRDAVILGGGPISMRSAWALRKLDIRISLVISSNRLLSRLVDEEVSLRLEEALLRDGGYRIYKNCDLLAARGKEKVESVELNNGESIPAQLIVVGKGVIANKELVEGTEIATANGILTDERMETNSPGVFAAGDVTQAYDRVRKKNMVNAIWPAAFAQGKVAGLNMAGASATFTGTVPMNVIEVGGVSLATIGVRTDKTVSMRAGNALKKIYLGENKITGAVFLDDLRGIGLLHTLIRNEVPLDRLPSPQRLLENIEYCRLLRIFSRKAG